MAIMTTLMTSLRRLWPVHVLALGGPLDWMRFGRPMSRSCQQQTWRAMPQHSNTCCAETAATDRTTIIVMIALMTVTLESRQWLPRASADMVSVPHSARKTHTLPQRLQRLRISLHGLAGISRESGWTTAAMGWEIYRISSPIRWALMYWPRQPQRHMVEQRNCMQPVLRLPAMLLLKLKHRARAKAIQLKRRPRCIRLRVPSTRLTHWRSSKRPVLRGCD